MSTVVNAGEEVCEMKHDIFEWSDGGQHVGVSVDQGRGEEEVAKFFELPEDVPVFNADFEHFIVFIFLSSAASPGVDYLDASELKIFVGVVFQIKDLSSDVAVRFHDHPWGLGHYDDNTGESQVFGCCKVNSDHEKEADVA